MSIISFIAYSPLALHTPPGLSYLFNAHLSPFGALPDSCGVPQSLCGVALQSMYNVQCGARVRVLIVVVVVLFVVTVENVAKRNKRCTLHS